MRFEHLVEINDASIPLLRPLSRGQLWRGLVMRAECPELSVVGLDDCRILERGEGSLRRELRFGQLRVRDEVRFVPQQSVVYQTEATGELPASRLAMTIEEPFPGSLFVRFTYTVLDSGERPEPDALVSAHLRQAYRQADIDTIVTIRQLLSRGLLGEDIH